MSVVSSEIWSLERNVQLKFLHCSIADKYLGQDLVLSGKDGAQVEQHAAFFDAGDDRRI
jgi:hypothetical protein